MTAKERTERIKLLKKMSKGLSLSEYTRLIELNKIFNGNDKTA